MTLTLEEQYIRSSIGTVHGGQIVITCDTYLAHLFHEARAFEVDTTFKRAVGVLNELEVVIWCGAAQRRKWLVNQI